MSSRRIIGLALALVCASVCMGEVDAWFTCNNPLSINVYYVSASNYQGVAYTGFRTNPAGEGGLYLMNIAAVLTQDGIAASLYGDPMVADYWVDIDLDDEVDGDDFWVSVKTEEETTDQSFIFTLYEDLGTPGQFDNGTDVLLDLVDFDTF